MKKIILIASAFIVVNLNAQKSFEKKTNVIGFGLDLGVQDSKYKRSNRAYQANKKTQNANYQHIKNDSKLSIF